MTEEIPVIEKRQERGRALLAILKERVDAASCNEAFHRQAGNVVQEWECRTDMDYFRRQMADVRKRFGIEEES